MNEDNINLKRHPLTNLTLFYAQMNETFYWYKPTNKMYILIYVYTAYKTVEVPAKEIVKYNVGETETVTPLWMK